MKRYYILAEDDDGNSWSLLVDAETVKQAIELYIDHWMNDGDDQEQHDILASAVEKIFELPPIARKPKARSWHTEVRDVFKFSELSKVGAKP